MYSRMLCTVFATFLYISAYSESHVLGVLSAPGDVEMGFFSQVKAVVASSCHHSEELCRETSPKAGSFPEK